MIKKNIHYVWLLLSVLLLTGTFSACDDDKPENRLAGTWTMAAISTDNQTLNTLLTQLLPQVQLPLNAITLEFGNEKNLTISYPTSEGIRSIPAAYAYDDKQLALRFDQLLPIPFNAFGIGELTEKKLVLTQTLPKNLVETVLQLISKELPDYTPYFQAVLAELKEKGLKIDLEFARTLAN